MYNIKNKFCCSAIILLCLLFSKSIVAQQIAYGNGNGSWNADSLGNHRAVIQFTGKGNVAKAVIGWRRRDFHPELKRIIVQDAKTGAKVNNVKTVAVSRESGTILF